MTTAEKIALATSPDMAADTTAAEKGPDKRRALGRGLDSLLPGRPRVVSSSPPTVMPSARGDFAGEEPGVVPELHAARMQPDSEVHLIPLDAIDENPYQTRRSFDETALNDLRDSILANGLVQPVMVRPTSKGRYVLVLGERRCRASRLAGKTTIPAIVRHISDQQAAEMTIVENMQRRDLNCLEQANAFARLSLDFGLTQEQIGQRTGVSRESVSNHMRLLRLPPLVQDFLSAGKLGFSEARVLLQLSGPDEISRIAGDAVRHQLSVVELQQLVERVNLREARLPAQDRVQPTDPNVRAAQTELERLLGVRVKINDRKGKGKIVIEYSTLEDFDRVLEMLKGTANH